jgi:D-cysteine desulfhydrase family pyridoxal phosphate-dependent enzyme
MSKMKGLPGSKNISGDLNNRMRTGNKLLQQFHRTPLSLLPTPFYKLSNLSAKLSQNLYCKRDDLTGFGFGGNKTRKLDFLLADALNKKADTLIAVGAVQSNFCRIAAAAGKVNNLETHLVLGGKNPEKPTGNFLLDHIFGAEIHIVESDDWNIWEEYAASLERDLARTGKNVYRMPVGGSTPTGALGYVDAFFEILDDCTKLNITADAIVHASSSGGTQAGLIVGKILSGWQGKIIGIGVAKTTTQLADEVYELASVTGKLFGVSVNRQDVIVDNEFMGPAYAARTEACTSACRMFAETEGIVLDNVYTGKAAAGLIEYTRRGLLSPDENIVFIHTGGTPEIFE